jgi:hypothetical protein
MRIVFALLSAVSASQVDVSTTASPVVCDKVPAGEYYGLIGIGKYLYLEVAEDSTSFRTSLGDYADSDSEMDSEDEDRWVTGAKWLATKVGFEMKPNCVGDIAQESRESYGQLLKSVSALVGICIHPGGVWDMVYDPAKDTLTLGCMTLWRAKDGVLNIRGRSVVPKMDRVVLPRGVFVNYYEGAMHAIRIVDRSTAWLKVVKGGVTKRVAAGYLFYKGEICIGHIEMFKLNDIETMGEISDYLSGISKTTELCFTYSPDKRSMTLGELEFKFEGVVPRTPRAYPH